MGERTRGDAAFLILKYLADNGPASYAKISEELGRSQSTVEYSVREILIKRHGLVKKLNSDKFALKWYTDEEETIRDLKRKLLRNPLPGELACMIKKPPSEARELLVKSIPSYREPTDEEIASSAKVLWMKIVSGSDLPSKKDLFERGVTKMVVEGVDQETLNKLLKIESNITVGENNDYLKDFPDLKPKIRISDDGNCVMYKLDWSDEAKRLLYPVDFWKQMAEVRIPRKYCFESIAIGLNDWENVEIADELAQIYVPSKEIIEYLLNLVGLPHNEKIVLNALRNFCENALEVGQLDDPTKVKIALDLLSVAFVMDISQHERHYKRFEDGYEERNAAFDIIKLLDVRIEDLVETAKDFVHFILKDPMYPEIAGPNIREVIMWLARDKEIKRELTDDIEQALKNADVIERVRFYKDLLVELSYQTPSCGTCAK
jgi:hypothetical protein